jgi:hypothetical protein
MGYSIVPQKYDQYTMDRFAKNKINSNSSSKPRAMAHHDRGQAQEKSG